MTHTIDKDKWNDGIMFATQSAMIATYEVPLGEQRTTVDAAAATADALFRPEFYNSPSHDNFLTKETLWLNNAEISIEVRHALKRMFLEMRRYLASQNIIIPDNFSAYTEISRLPGIIAEKGQKL